MLHLKTVVGAGIAALSMLVLFETSDANAARFQDPALRTPPMVENVACRVVRERIVRPNGRVVYRTKNVCSRGHSWRGRNCRTVRERIVRPSGAVVYRSVRRCR
jgi:hypothetical protein